MHLITVLVLLKKKQKKIDAGSDMNEDKSV